jgi:hypothetical protein
MGRCNIVHHITHNLCPVHYNWTHNILYIKHTILYINTQKYNHGGRRKNRFFIKNRVTIFFIIGRNNKHFVQSYETRKLGSPRRWPPRGWFLGCRRVDEDGGEEEARMVGDGEALE